jgi:uncharacterized protein (TIGR00725 family)
MPRRPLVAVIGNNLASDAGAALAEDIGRGLVEHGCRLVTGGLGGIMEAASRGARSARAYREGDVIGILPGPDPDAANAYVDIALATNMGYARNVLVVTSAEAVVAIGGGAGTLTELAMAWQLKKVVVALAVEGWSGRLAGERVDAQRDDCVLRADTAAEAVALVVERLALPRRI